MLIVPAANDGVHGLDTSTGRIIWSTDATAETKKTQWLYETWHFSSPIIWKSKQGKSYVLTSEAQGLTCRDPANGDKIWSISNSCAVYTTPIVVGSRLVMISKDGLYGYELSLQGPEQIWHAGSIHSSLRGDEGMPSPLVWDDHAFVMDQNAVLSCVSIDSGAVRWSQEIPIGRTWSCPIAADGKILWAFTKAGLYCLKPTSEGFHPLYAAKTGGGHVLNSFDPKQYGKGRWFDDVSSPSIAKGHMLIRDMTGTLLCYDLRRL